MAESSIPAPAPVTEPVPTPEPASAAANSQRPASTPALPPASPAPDAAAPALKAQVDELLRASTVAPDLDLDTTIPLYLSVLSEVEPTGASQSVSAVPATGCALAAAPLDIPLEPLPRACLFAATFLTGLNYPDLARVVAVIQPEPPAPPAPPVATNTPTPPALAVTVPAPPAVRDLTAALLAAGIRRVRTPEGRATMELAEPARREATAQRFLDEHFGMVHQACEALAQSPLGWEGSAPVRLGLAQLGGRLAAEDPVFAEATLARLAQDLEAAQREAGSSPDAMPFWKRVQAVAELLSVWWDQHGQVAAIQSMMEGLLARGAHRLLLGLLAGIRPLPADGHAGWLKRVAAEGGREGKALVAAELVWRLRQQPNSTPPHWTELLAWSRQAEAGPDSLAGWARRLVRRLLLAQIVDGPRGQLTREVLGAAAETAGAPPAENRPLAAQLVCGGHRGLAQQLALAVAADSFQRPAPGPAGGRLNWAECRQQERLCDPGHFVVTAGGEPAFDLTTAAGAATLAEWHAQLEAAAAGSGTELLAWLAGPAAAQLRGRPPLRTVTELCREFDELGQALARLRSLFGSTDDVSALDRACRNLRTRFRSATALRLWLCEFTSTESA